MITIIIIISSSISSSGSNIDYYVHTHIANAFKITTSPTEAATLAPADQIRSLSDACVVLLMEAAMTKRRLNNGRTSRVKRPCVMTDIICCDFTNMLVRVWHSFLGGIQMWQVEFQSPDSKRVPASTIYQ